MNASKCLLDLGFFAKVSLEPLAGGCPSWEWAHDMAADGGISLTLRKRSVGGSRSAIGADDLSCWAPPDASQVDDDNGDRLPFPTSRFNAGSAAAANLIMAPECDSSWQSSEL